MCYRYMQQQSSDRKVGAENVTEKRETALPPRTAPAREEASAAYARFMAALKRLSEPKQKETTQA